MTSDQKILIAGCGYVGMRAAGTWRAQGNLVTALTRTARRGEELQANGIKPLVASLTGPDNLVLPDCHIALWSVGFDRSVDRRAVWIDGLQRFLDAIPQPGSVQRLIYTSSTGVYGDGAGHDVDETTPANPSSEGGVACLEAEHIVRTFARENHIPFTILRLAGLYGPDRLLRRIADLKSGSHIAAAPDEWLNLIHVDDVVRLIDFLSAGSRPGALQSSSETVLPELINVVAANSVTRRQYYSALAQLTGSPEPVFTSTESLSGSPQRQRQNGNRRVVSVVRPLLSVAYNFDNHIDGLRDALERSQAPGDFRP